jgi:hypothetical protein
VCITRAGRTVAASRFRGRPARELMTRSPNGRVGPPLKQADPRPFRTPAHMTEEQSAARRSKVRDAAHCASLTSALHSLARSPLARAARCSGARRPNDR